MVCFFTDGITEAANIAGEEFGDERLLRLLTEHRHLSAPQLEKLLLEAVASFAGDTLQDDATLMIVSMR